MTVRTHSGYCADEHPVAFVLEGRPHTIKQVMERRRVRAEGVEREEFAVATVTGDEFRLVHLRGTDTWHTEPLT